MTNQGSAKPLENFWGNATVAALACKRRSEVVTNELLTGHRVEVLGVLATRFARDSFLIEVDVNDVQFIETGNADYTTLVTAYWSPKTHEVEFVGGPESGRIMTLERLDLPLRFPLLSVSWSLTEADPMELSDDTITYRMAGWSETHHRWVFCLDAVVESTA